MNINLHNYEEYLILYMDNELGEDDRRQVEALLEKHPDIREELDILLQFKMTPDTDIHFENKSQLIKEEGHSPIHAANYEEWLLLYNDNELSAAEALAVEEYIHSHPAARQTLQLLQQSRLQPERVAFPDKQALYKKEERRVIPFGWWRVAAVAMLVLAIGATLLITTAKKPATAGKQLAISNRQSAIDNKQLAITNRQQTIDKKQLVIANRQQPIDKKQLVIANRQQTIDKKQLAIANRQQTIDKKQPATDNRQLATVNTQSVTGDQQPATDNSNHLPKPLNNPNYTNTNMAQVNTTEAINPRNIVTTGATPTSYNTSRQEDADFDQPAEKKTKLRGLFRKLTRTFEKNTNMNATDNDRVLVGGLAIKLR